MQAQHAYFENKWKEVDSLVEKLGRTESALKITNDLYKKAVAEKNEVQQIKSLKYRIYLEQHKYENALLDAIGILENESSKLKGIAHSILLSLTAEAYWNYYRNNQYELSDRTTVVDSLEKNIELWSEEQLHQKITSLYIQSIENKSAPQKTTIDSYEPLLKKGNTPALRPTVYDLLVHRALEYFQSDNGNLLSPAAAFELSQEQALSETSTFASWELKHQDSLDKTFLALSLFQELVKFHLNDKDPAALIDADILRIEYVYANAVMNNKDQLYLDALKSVTDKYASNPAAAQAWYLQAQYYANLGAQYDASMDELVNQDSLRYAYIKALELCRKASEQTDSSEGRSNCLSLISQITGPSLQIDIEEVNTPDQPSRILVSYRNINKIYGRIIQHDNEYWKEQRQHWQEDFWHSLVKEKFINSFELELPDTKDHQSHRLESMIMALPTGHYSLLVSTDSTFKVSGSNYLASVEFQSSGIATFHKGSDHFIVDRETGMPLPNATVREMHLTYDEKQRKNFYRLGATLFADQEGRFITNDSASRYRQEIYEIIYKKDRLLVKDFSRFISYREGRNWEKDQQGYEKDNRNTFLFTDRAIYRPGQVVEFKGLVTTKDFQTKDPRIEQGFTTKIHLLDANYEMIDSLVLTTNKFGSFHGKFQLPANRLNGAFTIKDSATNATSSFSVEEYKRPKFSVEIKLPSETYVVGDTINVKGVATAFAGNSIANAAVRYRVTRRSMLPFWVRNFYSKIWPPYGQEEMEIASGITNTDASGNFNVTFNAIPDKKIKESFNPTFHYEISADVTDINGETHSDLQMINAGYAAFTLQVDAPTEFSYRDPSPAARIITENMNGQPVSSIVKVLVSKLEEPKRLLRKRLWEQPDQFIIDEPSFIKNFPFDVYKNEDEITNWKKSKEVLQFSDSSNKKLVLAKKPLEEGWYLVEVAAKDETNKEVSAKHYFKVTGPKKITGPAFAAVEANKEIIEPGESLNYSIHTNLDNARIVYQEITNDSTGDIQYHINKRQPLSKQKVFTEKERGHYRIVMATVKHNRIYTAEQTIAIPFSNKELKVKLETFRDKTLPGSTEQWKISILSNDDKIVPAEIASVLFDASLDELRRHSWWKPGVWNKPLDQSVFNGSNNFRSKQSEEKSTYVELPPTFLKTYSQLDYSPVEEMHQEVYSMAVKQRAKGEEEIALQGAIPGIQITRKNAPSAADVMDTTEASVPKKEQSTPIRRDFRETAFFFPQLYADDKGNVDISFTIPDALTTWRWISFAHTQDLSMGLDEKTIITQKPLMVQPNMPRFFREGDRIDLTTKVVNMSDKEMTGQVELQLIDPETNQPIDGWFRNFFPNQYFTAGAGESVSSSFSIEVPFLYGKPVVYRFYVRSDSTTDAEEGMIPVLTNRQLVTETKTIDLQDQDHAQLQFKTLLQSDSSETLSHHKLTVEYTANPSWLVVQSLPYLNEIKDGSSDQVFGRIYANAIAAKILRSSPIIEQVLKDWQKDDTSYLSKLEQNPELKNILLQQTPWIFEAKSESAQHKDLLKLFDSASNNLAINTAIEQLKQLQLDNGAFSWMNQGPADRFITQEILIGIGRLIRLDALNPIQEEILLEIAKNALPYTHEQILDDHKKAKKNKTASLHTMQMHYLYMLTYFQGIGVPGTAYEAFNFYRKLSQTQWIKLNRYGQAVAALSLHRTGDKLNANKILRSLQENALTHKELGMYWKDMTGGYYWYQSAIEAQALLIETFHELNAPAKQVNALKTWLLRNKQTNNWGNVSATADACYALLTTGDNWLKETPVVKFNLGNKVISSANQPQEGPGYFKTAIEGKDVNATMGNISVELKSTTKMDQPSWGAVYWQYFEELDKIKSSAGALTTKKDIFIERNSEKGPVLEPVTDGTMIKVGDRIKVRIQVNADRAMEYIHVSDMRAASFEPTITISGYRWNGGLGFYQTTRDASTDFYIDHLPKGNHLFEYSLVATTAGTFSNGITRAQCMYAPEFISHTAGIRVIVEQP